MKNLIFLFFALFCFIGISAQETNTEKEVVEAQTGAIFGDSAKFDTSMDITELSSVTKTEEIDGFFSGKVVDACSKLGCWLELETETGHKARVKMNDHAFFVPQSIIGKEVIVQGTASYKIVPVEELQHLAEDAGKSQEEIDEITDSQEDLIITAEGVKVSA